MQGFKASCLACLPHPPRVVTRAPGFNTIRGLDEEHWQHASHMSSSL